MATRMPNPINFYYTSNESLFNKLSSTIKYVLMYTRTHLIRSDEPRKEGRTFPFRRFLFELTMDGYFR